MRAQIIKKDGKEAFAVVPVDEYKRLLEAAENFNDNVAYDRAIKDLETDEDELIPSEFAERLLEGDEHPLKVWREFRGMTQQQLAGQAGISQGQVALIEGGKRQGTVDVLKRVAGVLNVGLDDLVG